MKQIREVSKVFRSKPTLEGAGVHLKRVFGYNEVPLFDPFLLLDHFGSDNPDDYLAGFPWHPHRGIETVTYMISGAVQHGDSIGNSGVIHSGDVQWMTAGSGIIHQEMPEQTNGPMMGFQLWVNLPSSHKMMDPRYRGINKDQLPLVSPTNGTTIRIISGEVNGTRGPVQDLITEVEYLDVSLNPGVVFEHPIKPGFNAFAYVFQGSAAFGLNENKTIPKDHLVLFRDGDRISIKADQTEGVRFILISGNPIKESVAWYGPIVMNTNEEIQLAFDEYRHGIFIKTPK